MIKFDFNIWNQQNSLEQNNDDLPLFIDINNLFIKNKNYIDLIDVIQIDKFTRIDSIVFDKYGGYSMVEQFNIIKVILPLILIFNEFNDISEIKPGLFLKLPDLNMLINNLYIFDENDIVIDDTTKYDDNKLNLLPGLNLINKYNLKLESEIDETKTVGIPGMNLVLDKVSYDSEKGIVIY